MEFFKIGRDIPFMRYALIFNAISVATFVLALFFLITLWDGQIDVLQIVGARTTDADGFHRWSGTVGEKGNYTQNGADMHEQLVICTVNAGVRRVALLSGNDNQIMLSC